MSEKEWDRFFELLNKIINGQGVWSDKAAKVRDEANSRDDDDDLQEFIGWFASEE